MLLSHKAIRAVADFQGQKIRTQGGAPIQVEPLKKVGVLPVSLPLGEALPAMQNRTIDGMVAAAAPFVAFKYYDIAKPMTYPAGHDVRRTGRGQPALPEVARTGARSDRARGVPQGRSAVLGLEHHRHQAPRKRSGRRTAARSSRCRRPRPSATSIWSRRSPRRSCRPIPRSRRTTRPCSRPRRSIGNRLWSRRSPAPTTSGWFETDRLFRVGGHIARRTERAILPVSSLARRTPRWMLSPTILGLPQGACVERRRPGGPLPCPPELDTSTRRPHAGVHVRDAPHWPRGRACRATSREA